MVTGDSCITKRKKRKKGGEVGRREKKNQNARKRRVKKMGGKMWKRRRRRITFCNGDFEYNGTKSSPKVLKPGSKHMTLRVSCQLIPFSLTTPTHTHLAFAFVLCKKLPSLCFISCFFFSPLKTLLYSPSNSPLKRRRSSLDPPCVHK